ncbi:flagellar basal body L-ring protein FlgH [Mucisphaera sp.]|uniref:flagellar basal body L-ring protein FlgH n=1 Tax=Mucisphaera sp. TaxID=2913024 RepID=UPI003D0EC1D5
MNQRLIALAVSMAWLALPAAAQDGVVVDSSDDATQVQEGSFLFSPAANVGEPDVYEAVDDRKRMHEGISEVSYAAVETPDIRRFQVNDLIMIIVRESFSSSAEQTTETEKEGDVSANISRLPDLRASDLIDLQLRMNTFGVQPGVDADFSKSFEGEGDYSRSDTMAGRVMARVVDVKPNATLVLEARDRIQTDDEVVSIVVSGTARAQDVTEQNSIESDQLYGLSVRKEHEGELRKANKRGWITRTFDAIFDF